MKPSADVVVAPVSFSAPENVLLSPKRVELAAVIVIEPLPSNATLFIFCGVCNLVAVPALPVMFPTIVWMKVSRPANTLLSESSVEEAAVIVPELPSEIEVLLTVRDELVSPALFKVPDQSGVIVNVPPEFEIASATVSPLKDVEVVAIVIAPIWGVPYVC